MKITIINLVRMALLGIVIMSAGGATNQFVVNRNHGTMPVWVINKEFEESMMGDFMHSTMTEDSQYKILCDIFVIPEITRKGIEYVDIMSLGDLFIFGGEVLVCLSQILLLYFPLRWVWKALKWINKNFIISLR